LAADLGIQVKGKIDRSRLWKRVLRSEKILAVEGEELIKRIFIGVGKKGCPNLSLGQSYNYNPRSKDFEYEWNPREERES